MDSRREAAQQLREWARQCNDAAEVLEQVDRWGDPPRNTVKIEEVVEGAEESGTSSQVRGPYQPSLEWIQPNTAIPLPAPKLKENAESENEDDEGLEEFLKAMPVQRDLTQREMERLAEVDGNFPGIGRGAFILRQINDRRPGEENDNNNTVPRQSSPAAITVASVKTIPGRATSNQRDTAQGEPSISGVSRIQYRVLERTDDNHVIAPVEDPPAYSSTRCWNCLRLGHRYSDCPEPMRIFCRGCGRWGFTLRTCPVC